MIGMRRGSVVPRNVTVRLSDKTNSRGCQFDIHTRAVKGTLCDAQVDPEHISEGVFSVSFRSSLGLSDSRSKPAEPSSVINSQFLLCECYILLWMRNLPMDRVEVTRRPGVWEFDGFKSLRIEITGFDQVGNTLGYKYNCEKGYHARSCLHNVERDAGTK